MGIILDVQKKQWEPLDSPTPVDKQGCLVLVRVNITSGGWEHPHIDKQGLLNTNTNHLKI